MPAEQPAPGQAAPELAAAMAETRRLLGGYRTLCEEFGDNAVSGMSARISLTILNRHRRRASLPDLPRSAARDREDITMRYRRERDEAREELAAAHALASRWGAIGGDLGTCARELRAALEGGGDEPR